MHHFQCEAHNFTQRRYHRCEFYFSKIKVLPNEMKKKKKNEVKCLWFHKNQQWCWVCAVWCMTTIKAIASDGRTQTALTKRHTQEMATERASPQARKRKTKQRYIYIHARGTYYMHVVSSTIMSLSITYVYGRCRSQLFSLLFSCCLHTVQGLPSRAYTTEHSKHFNQIIHWIQNDVHKYIVSDTHVAHTTAAPVINCYYQFAEKKRERRKSEIKIEFAAVCRWFRSSEINWQHCCLRCQPLWLHRVDLRSYVE